MTQLAERLFAKEAQHNCHKLKCNSPNLYRTESVLRRKPTYDFVFICPFMQNYIVHIQSTHALSLFRYSHKASSASTCFVFSCLPNWICMSRPLRVIRAASCWNYNIFLTDPFATLNYKILQVQPLPPISSYIKLSPK